MPLTPGTRLGPYEITAPLGAGGMGEVYRARDTRLSREVAIKVLPEHLSRDPEVRARFEREARTISGLNDPHICVLYDVGRQGDTDFLVMELIEGETLAERLARGALPAAEVLRFGAQIAGALDRAHRAGVVHRDLKPGNVMLTRSGAKLMDFGLARGAGGPPAGVGPLSGSPTLAAPITAEGTIVGTFQYMAPEQLEGKEADERSDLWALGCVLYEMATGACAFAAASQASLIAAIMTSEPPSLTALQPLLPVGLDRLVRQCLAKSPDERLQSARDVVFLLDLIAAGGVPAAARTDGPTPGRRPRAAVTGLIAAGLLLAAAAGFFAGRATAPPGGGGAIRASTLSQGTRDSDPAVSPEGRMVAFRGVRPQGQGIWLMDMATRSEVKLTDGNDRAPRFSADGGTVMFTRTERGRVSLWRIPVLGGTARPLLQDASDADPSPGGDRIAYIGGITEAAGVRAQLMVARSDATSPRELWSRGGVVIGAPRWSPDGSRIAMVSAGNQNSPSSIIVVDAGKGTARQYPAPGGFVLSNPVWDGSGDGIIVAEGVGVTAIQRGASGRLFRLSTRSGRYQPLGWLDAFPVTIDLLPDGRVVLSCLVGRQNLREVRLDARDLVGGRWLTSGMAIDRQPVYSPDGRSVLFSSNRGGTLDLWEVSVETGEMHRVTDDPEDDWDPEYSPDGRSIVWCSGRSGAFEIWTARRDGSVPRQISRDSLDAENPSISPDGRWVYYSSSHPAKSGLWRIPATGGPGERLLRSGTLIPDLSPDGRYVAVSTAIGTPESRLSVFDLVERRELPVPVPLQVTPGTVQVGRSRFTPDGTAVVFVQIRESGHAVLLRRPLAAWRGKGGRVDTLFAGAGETIESFGFSADGRRAVVSVLDWLSGLTIADAAPGVVPPKRRR